jgi:small basic protein
LTEGVVIPGVSSHSGGWIVVGWEASAVFGGVRWTLEALFKFNSPAIHIVVFLIQVQFTSVLVLKLAALEVTQWWNGIISFCTPSSRLDP